jgi:class 3 adenylate cyclase/tetratricopeptide (TPR) repeat protein
MISQGSGHCALCGFPLAAGAASSVEAGHTARPNRAGGFNNSGERKFLTVMFADIVGSTRMVEGLDPELSIAALEPIVRIMFRAAHTYGGTVNRVQGDGVMALFGAPVAHEDHAARACLAGLMLIEEVGKLASPQAQVRVGLHSGLVVVRPIYNDMSIAYEAGGPAVHLAARMEQICDPGTVRASAVTCRLASTAIIAESLGPVTLKGFSAPVESFVVRGIARRVRAATEVMATRHTPFVGRTAQMSLLRRAVELCEAGSGQPVLITGHPGIGKSRLVQECLNAILTPKWLVLRAECAPYHRNTAYHAFRQLLRSWTGLDEVAPAVASRSLATALERLDAGLRNEIAPLASLLGIPAEDDRWDALDPPARRRRITEAIGKLVAALASGQLTALVFEDLHWADPETVRVLQHLIARIGKQRCLLLATSREAQPILPATIALDRLAHEQAARLLDELLGSDRGLQMLKRQILESTQGVPLFITETVNALADAGDIVKSSSGYKLRRRLTTLGVPATLNTLLSSRIDQIDRSLKWVLQVASIIGNEVPVTILARVLGRSDQSLIGDIDELEKLDFLQRHEQSAANMFCFKHSLVREAAYESLLHDQRIVLHAAVAESIEALFHNQLENHVERLADHAVIGELWEKAAFYTQEAADKAIRHSALHEACRFLEMALTCVGKLPKDPKTLARTAELHLKLRMALWPLGSVEEANSHLDQAEVIAEELGDHYRLGQISVNRTQILSSEGNLNDAIDAGSRARARAALVGDRALALRADFVLAQAYQFRGDFRRSIEVLGPRQAEILGALRHERLLSNPNTTSVQHLVILSRAHCMLGEFVTARRLATEAVEIGRVVDRGFDVGFALQALGMVALLRGDLLEASGPLEEALRICEGNSLDTLFPLVASPLGLVYTGLGRLDAGRQLLDDACSVAQQARLVFYHAWSTALLARAAILCGTAREVVDAVEASLVVARANEYKWIEAWLRHALGVILAMVAPQTGLDQILVAARLASELEMLPDVALCDWSSAAVLDRLGRTTEAEARRVAASNLSRRLGMTAPKPGEPDQHVSDLN